MARPIEAARPHKLKGFWFLVRRVPGEFSAYDRRNLVRISTGIRIVDDPRGIRAAEVVAKLHTELVHYWKDKKRGRDRDAEARYEQARKRARFGFALCASGRGRAEFAHRRRFASLRGNVAWGAFRSRSRKIRKPLAATSAIAPPESGTSMLRR